MMMSGIQILFIYGPALLLIGEYSAAVLILVCALQMICKEIKR